LVVVRLDDGVFDVADVLLLAADGCAAAGLALLAEPAKPMDSAPAPAVALTPMIPVTARTLRRARSR
jgi:hypothetical protein